MGVTYDIFGREVGRKCVGVPLSKHTETRRNTDGCRSDFYTKTRRNTDGTTCKVTYDKDGFVVAEQCTALPRLEEPVPDFYTEKRRNTDGTTCEVTFNKFGREVERK